MDLTNRSTLLERGVFYFFFGPRVEIENVPSLNDVQNPIFSFVRQKSDVCTVQKNLRIIQIPKKAPAATGTHERFLGFVISNDESVKVLKMILWRVRILLRLEGRDFDQLLDLLLKGYMRICGDPDGRTTHFAYLLNCRRVLQ